MTTPKADASLAATAGLAGTANDLAGAANSLAGASIKADDALAGLEVRLAALHRALMSSDAAAIEAEAQGLQRALHAAAPALRDARHAGGIPDSTRHLLERANAAVVAQREALARAGAATERALAMLTSRAQQGVYSSQGAAEAAAPGNLAQA